MLHKSLLYTPVVELTVSTFNKKPVRQASDTSLEFARFLKIGNTGRFFKQITFLGLAFNNLTDKRYRKLTIRSVIMSLWDMIAPYNVIF